MKNYNLLVSLDANYLPPLRTMLRSAFFHNKDSIFTIYLLHSSIPDDDISSLSDFVRNHNSVLVPIIVDKSKFDIAPTTMNYSIEMYYRLLAFSLLPSHVEKILYLDPDTIIINSIDELYSTNIDDYLFAAASHSPLALITDPINKVRLGTDNYYNTGTLLMNLVNQRKEMSEQQIFSEINESKNPLILPDQDVMNVLYSERTLPLDDSLYNFDTRKFGIYQSLSGGVITLDWVLKNTVILHYCGKNKPWHKPNGNKFVFLYKHYQNNI